MPPIIHGFPVKRKNYILQANWLGDDDDLSLQVVYPNQQGGNSNISFETRNAERKGNICLPTSNDVADLGEDGSQVRDILAAHVRMACLISGLAVPGSKEFEDSFTQLEANHFQTALGTVKITDVQTVDDQCVHLEFRKGSGTKRTYVFDYQELCNYTYVPQTQLLVLAGAIEKEFPSYVHDHPNNVLTQQQKDDIAAHLLTIEPWI